MTVREARIRATCGRCGAGVLTRIPKGGTGDYRRPYPHKSLLTYEPCDGRFYGAVGWGWPV